MELRSLGISLCVLLASAVGVEAESDKPVPSPTVVPAPAPPAAAAPGPDAATADGAAGAPEPVASGADGTGAPERRLLRGPRGGSKHKAGGRTAAPTAKKLTAEQELQQRIERLRLGITAPPDAKAGCNCGPTKKDKPHFHVHEAAQATTCPEGQIQICHRVSSEGGLEMSLCLPEESAARHRAHGDTDGACGVVEGEGDDAAADEGADDAAPAEAASGEAAPPAETGTPPGETGTPPAAPSPSGD